MIRISNDCFISPNILNFVQKRKGFNYYVDVGYSRRGHYFSVTVLETENEEEADRMVEELNSKIK